MPDDDEAQSFDASSPAIYLGLPPTPENHSLAGSVGLHDSAAVPFHMFAKVADRLHKVSTWASRFDVFMRRGKRWAYAGISAALLNLGIAGHFVIDRAEAVGAAEERAAGMARDVERYRAATDERLSDLRSQIQELRTAMYRKSGIDPLPLPRPPNSGIPRPALDKLALTVLTGPSCSILDSMQAMLTPIPPFPIPDSCGAPCSSGLECSQHDILRACPFCNFGTCRSTRPDNTKGPR
jgi:hypothetical protein